MSEQDSMRYYQSVLYYHASNITIKQCLGLFTPPLHDPFLSRIRIWASLLNLDTVSKLSEVKDQNNDNHHKHRNLSTNLGTIQLSERNYQDRITSQIQHLSLPTDPKTPPPGIRLQPACHSHQHNNHPAINKAPYRPCRLLADGKSRSRSPI